MMYSKLVDPNPWKNEYSITGHWKRLEGDIDEYKEYEDWDMILSGNYTKENFNSLLTASENFVYFNRD